MKQIVSPGYFQQQLGCTHHELRHGLGKVMSLYGDLRELKLFDAYRYYYHISFSGEELKAAITMKENYITLAQYASRRNLQIIPGVDFNEKLRGRGCPRYVTVQKVCRYSRDEALDEVWGNPEESRAVLTRLTEENRELYEFEKKLES